MRNPGKRLLIALLWLLPTVLPAAAPMDLYVAEKAVADESSETRNALLSELLADVLMRVSGNAAITGQPAAREVLAAAPSLVEQYRYRSAEDNGTLVRYLWARFDQPAVERMLRERNLPVWVQRPRVLLWLATEQGGQRVLLSLDSEPAARDALLAQARRRGMPLQLPLMDLEDQAQLTPADVWADYHQAILQASTRYPFDSVMTGRLRAQGDGRWSGIWSIIDREVSQSFQTSPQPLADSLVFAVDQVQNLLAARYAPMPGVGGAQGTLVQFADVYDLAAYGRLVEVLEGLDSAARVALRHVDQDSFTFEFQLRGGVDDLGRALDASGRLLPEPAPLRPLPAPGTPSQAGEAVPAMAPQADLYYRLVN